MMFRKGKRWLAILLAVLLCFSTLAFNFVMAEENTAVEEVVKQEEAPKPQEPPKQEAPKQEAPKQEEPPKQEAPKQEETPKQEEAPKPVEAPKQETAPEQAAPPVQEEAPVAPPAQEPVEVKPPVEEAPVEDDIVQATQLPIVPPTDVPEEAPTSEPTAAPEDPEQSVSPEEPENTPELDAGTEPVPTVEPTPTPTPVPSFEMRGRSNAWSDLHLDPGSLRIPSDGMPIPLLYQFDYRKSVCRVDGDSKSVASSGCGAAAASMLIAYVRQDYNQTPYTLFYWAAEHGRYRGDGLDYEGIRTMLINHGVDTRLMGVSSDGIISALKENRPIIIKMGPGTFTDGGHFIVLRGLDENGKVLVNDPNSSGRSQQSYSASLIARECKSDHMIVAYTLPGGVAEEKEIKEEAEEPVVSAKETPVPAEEAPVSEEAVAETASETEDGSFDAAYLARVQYESVNLREAPVDGQVVTSVKEGEVLCVTNEVNAGGRVWCAVEYQGKTLYIRGDMITADGVGITMDAYNAQAAVEPEEVAPVVVEEAAPEPVSATEDGEFEGSYLGVVNAKSVNLRDLPGTDKTKSLVVTSVKEGTVLCVVGEETDEDGRVWCAVLYQKQKLYIRGDMLAVLN